ncbi:MAG: hypothetical protein ABFQ64_03670 [Campylobacterota bacterium]
MLNADRVNKRALACPDIDKLKKAPVHEGADPLGLSMYIVANNCEILSKDAHIEAIGYDPRNSTEIFQKILDKKSGAVLYILRSSIVAEQGGKKNSLKF